MTDPECTHTSTGSHRQTYCRYCGAIKVIGVWAPSPTQRIRELEADVDECSQLTNRLSKLLTDTANVLKGEPPELVLHDWSDLPEVAQRLVTERDQLREALETIATPAPYDSTDCHGCAAIARAALGVLDTFCENCGGPCRDES